MMDKRSKSVLEILLGELGSFGRFQIIILQCVFIPKGLVGYSLVLPSFTAATPDWWCIPAGGNDSQSQRSNETFKKCSVNSTECVRHYDSNMVTTVSEWDLVCDRKWVTNTITSIQMAGILVGVVTTGQVSDSFGRKKILFFAILMHSLLNFVCPFSVAWEMFGVLRFLIGACCGMILCSSYPYVLEFTVERWRPLLGALPYWSVAVVLLALLGWLLPNWKYMHVFCGAANVPFLLGYFFLPESMRWLVVHGRVDEAERVANLVARYNRVEPPRDVRARLQAVADEERRGKQNVIKYSYIDVFRGKTMIKTTVCSGFVWCSCSIVYYGVTFAVQSLSGNLFLNIFLLTVIEIPVFLSTFWSLRRFGRKWTAMSFLFSGGCFLVAMAIIKTTNQVDNLDTAMAILAKVAIGGAWIIMYTYTNELYPTVVRTIGFGISQSCARAGGILAPLILLTNGGDVIVPYVTMGVLIIMSAACLFLLPETKGRPLEENIKYKNECHVVIAPNGECGSSDSDPREKEAMLDEPPETHTR